MTRRLGRILVPLCTAICAIAVVLWILSLLRSVEAGYAWQHKSRTPYLGSGYVALASSDGVILVGGGVVPVAHPSGWSSRVGPVIPYGAGSESMLSQMGFGSRGIGRWGDEFFDREYVAPWWGVFVLTAWAPAVLVHRRRRRDFAAASETNGSSSSPGDAA
jgi:hypothetical protein